MNRDWSKIFMCVIVAAYVSRDIWLTTRPSPPTIDGPTCIVKLTK